MLDKSDKIYIAGHNGMVGSAFHRLLKEKGHNNLIFKNHNELDLTIQSDVENYLKKEKPDLIILAAAKVGGININNKDPCSFLMENLIIQHNIISTAFKYDIENLIFLGSSCIYPTKSQQPIKEEYLLTGKLEPTNEGYALAKISGLKACEYYNKQYGTNYFGVMPTNLYGINDNFDLKTSHVVPALIRKMHEAKIKNNSTVEIWGSGNQYRELMYVDDMVEATMFAFDKCKEQSFINIGTGIDNTLKDISYKIKEIVEYKGNLYFDKSKPDGMHRKLLDITKLKKNFIPKYKIFEYI